MVNYPSNPTPLTADINWRNVGIVLVAVVIFLIIVSSGSKVVDGIIREPEVKSYLQRMEDTDLTDEHVPTIDIQSASSQSLLWGELYMVRYTYVLDGKVQKTAYCTKGPDNPLFCSPYPPQRNR